MYFCDFVIPLNREELLNSSNSGQFVVKDEYSIEELREKLEEARIALNEEGIDFIFDHFSTYFWTFQKFKQCSQMVREKGWKSIKKGFSLLSKNLQVLFEDSSNIDSDIQSKMCNITKMTVYALIEYMKMNQELYTEQTISLDGKCKKKQTKMTNEEENWNEEKHSVLREIHMFLQFPFKMLWDPPVVEEEFINLIANFCYICLEDPTIASASSKCLRETIFQILGILIKNYLHGLSFCVKVVQLLRMNDHLVNPLAQGIVQLVVECDCSNIIKEIVREVGETDGDQLAADSAGTRNLNLFLVQVAESIPETIIPAIDLLVSHLSGDSYSMRICVIGVLGEIVLTVLTKANLEESVKKMRNEYLDILEEHIHDVNAFVRTKVLQVWQKLCMGKAIPILRINRLLDLVIGRLFDKSTNVKKQAVHLIKDLLEGNPFCGELNLSEIQSQLSQEKRELELVEKDYSLKDWDAQWREVEPKLKELVESEIDSSEVLDYENMSAEEIIASVGNHLMNGELAKAVATIRKFENKFYVSYGMKKDCSSPEAILLILQKIFEQSRKPDLMNASPEVQDKVQKHLKTIEYLESALQFSQLIDKALPIILTFLDSNVVTDILEAIHFFTAAHLFGFKQALEGVRKMLYLVFSKESNVRAAVSGAYKELYFQKSGTDRQQSLATVKNLSELVLKLNYSQLDALQEVVKEWANGDIIDKSCVQVLFERFSMKLPGTGNDHSWAALVLIRMVGGAEAKIIKSNLSVFLNEGLKNGYSNNFLMAKETCKALQYLLPPKEQGKVFDHTLRYPIDHEIFQSLYNLLKFGIQKVGDPYYVPMAEEAINLVFAICDKPDNFCKNLIVDLHEGITTKKKPTEKKKTLSANVLNKNTEEFFLGDENEQEEKENRRPEREEEENNKFDGNPDELFITLLTRFISVLGQIASNYVLYLEQSVLDELKRRNQLEYERKLRKFEENKKLNANLKKGRRGGNETGAEKTLQTETGTEDLEFNRVAADDMDTEEMRKKTEKGVVTGEGFLAKYAPLIITICKNPGKYNNTPLQNAALLTLSKFMQVSSEFCEENLQLLVTICEKSQISESQENGIIALGALQYRFPNSLEPWTPHMYAMLQNPNPSVRYSSILVLTDLIVNEMIKVRSHISNLALCIVDKEIKIARVARHFFREYSQKGNSLYNVLPNLISSLTQTNSPLTSNEFKVIMKYILGLVTKEKQSEYLVEKLCQYFESATTERQWCDLSYCLSLLSYSDKGLKKLLENVRCFANKLYLAEVYEAFCTIISDAGKNPQKDKTLVSELNSIVKEFRDKSCEDNMCAVSKKICPPSAKKKIARRKYLPSESEDEECDMKLRAGQLKRKNSYHKDLDLEVEHNGCLDNTSLKRLRTKRGDLCITGNKENRMSDGYDSDESIKKQQGRSIRTRMKPKKKKKAHCSEAVHGSSDDEEREEMMRGHPRNGKKR